VFVEAGARLSAQFPNKGDNRRLATVSREVRTIREAAICGGVHAALCRLSFSVERAYEIGVPA